MMMWPLPDDGSFSDRRRPQPANDPDLQLAYSVAIRMAANPELQHQRITIEVQNRVVLLSGTVDSQGTQQTAGDTARQVDGVRDVCNDIRVDRPADQPAAAVTATSSHDPFDQITQRLSAELRPAGRASRRLRRLGVVVLAALLWAALSVLMVRDAWISVAVTCAVAAVAVHFAHGRRHRTTAENDEAPYGRIGSQRRG